MNAISSITGDQLADALRELGVHFILGGNIKDDDLSSQPVRLIVGLAQSDESRLRLSLIPLFLEHPEFARYVHTAEKDLAPSARLVLHCYYTAAVWLGKKYLPGKPALPDYFSSKLDLVPINDPDKNLHALAERQQALSGSLINWLGTYQHAAQIWMSTSGLAYG